MNVQTSYTDRSGKRRITTSTAPTRYLSTEQIPAWMHSIPAHLTSPVAYNGSEGFAPPNRIKALEGWLAERGFPRPTYLELESLRASRGQRRPLAERSARPVRSRRVISKES